MDREWAADQPIYRQLRDMIVAMIVDGTLKEDDALPSVRQIAADYRVNPLTVLKCYQQLVEEGLVEKRRGVGMFVTKGAPAAALRHEREKFLREDWPRIVELMERLGLTPDQLLDKKSSGLQFRSTARTTKR
jgi:GntR family transcriptional regulator